MKKNVENILNKALKLKNEGKYEEAIDLLNEYNGKQEAPKVIYLLAALHFLTASYERSSKYYERLIKVYPNSEIISTGLFQSYWNCGSFNEAFLELERFLSVNVPVETYLTILEEHHSLINNETPKNEKTIITKYFNKYFNSN